MIKIGKRKIGYKFKPLIICELGINHGGSLKLAKKMVHIAFQAGAEAIKNQRIVFHYDWLRSDINHIQDGINEKLNQTNLAPRVIPPIKGDYQNAPSMRGFTSNG